MNIIIRGFTVVYIKQVMQDALETFEKIDTIIFNNSEMELISSIDSAIENLYQAIKELDGQEAVAIVRDNFPCRIAWMSEPPDSTELYTYMAPIRELSDEDIIRVRKRINAIGYSGLKFGQSIAFAREILKKAECNK